MPTFCSVQRGTGSNPPVTSFKPAGMAPLELAFKSTFSLHKDPNSLAYAEVNHTCRSYIYTRGILYGQIPRWKIKQLAGQLN